MRRNHLNLIPSTSYASTEGKATKYNSDMEVIHFNSFVTNTVHYCPYLDKEHITQSARMPADRRSSISDVDVRESFKEFVEFHGGG